MFQLIPGQLKYKVKKTWLYSCTYFFYLLLKIWDKAFPLKFNTRCYLLYFYNPTSNKHPSCDAGKLISAQNWITPHPHLHPPQKKQNKKKTKWTRRLLVIISFQCPMQPASCQLAHLHIKLISTQTLLANNKSQYCSSCSIINLHSVELGHDILFYPIQCSINHLRRLVLEQRVGLKMFRQRLKSSWFVHVHGQ